MFIVHILVVRPQRRVSCIFQIIRDCHRWQFPLCIISSLGRIRHFPPIAFMSESRKCPALGKINHKCVIYFSRGITCVLFYLCVYSNLQKLLLRLSYTLSKKTFVCYPFKSIKTLVSHVAILMTGSPRSNQKATWYPPPRFILLIAQTNVFLDSVWPLCNKSVCRLLFFLSSNFTCSSIVG